MCQREADTSSHSPVTGREDTRHVRLSRAHAKTNSLMQTTQSLSPATPPVITESGRPQDDRTRPDSLCVKSIRRPQRALQEATIDTGCHVVKSPFLEALPPSRRDREVPPPLRGERNRPARTIPQTSRTPPRPPRSPRQALSSLASIQATPAQGLRDMAYFLTGATGFIGRRLVAHLLANREGKIHVL